MAQPLSGELTHCSLLPLLEKDIRGRKKIKCTEKEDRERRLSYQPTRRLQSYFSARRRLLIYLNLNLTRNILLYALKNWQQVTTTVASVTGSICVRKLRQSFRAQGQEVVKLQFHGLNIVRILALEDQFLKQI